MAGVPPARMHLLEGYLSTSFDTWLGTLPRWLQTGAAGLIADQAAPDAGRIAALANLCIAEAAKEPATYKVVPARVFDTPVAGRTVRLRRIHNVVGVNALDPKAGLDFGDANIAVVYGHNGTGKSGFARLTKEAAAGRARARIHPNVFAFAAPEPQATFVVQVDGHIADPVWKQATGPVPQLRNLHVFDRDVALSYVNDKAEARYEPRRLRFITALVDLSDRVRAELQQRVTALPSALPAIPSALVGTALANDVQDLKPSMSDDDLRKKVHRADNHADRVRELEEALRAPDPAARIQAIEKTLRDVESLAKLVATLAEALSLESIRSVTKAKADAEAARTAADAVAAVTFKQSCLPGVGETVWQAMWEAAREYSTSVAFPGHPFPHVEDALCPLCQQALGAEAGRRLASFEAFIKGEVKAQAKASEAEHRRLTQALPRLQALVDWKARFALLPGAEPLVEAAHVAATATLAALGQARTEAEVPLSDLALLQQALRAHREALEAEQALIQATQKEGERLKLGEELRYLKMLDWCNENLPSLLDELARKRKVARLESATKTTNTAGLTRKKTDLAKDELTGGYQQRFDQELKALGAARLRVKPVETKGAKGRVTFGLTITDAKTAAPPGEVLSEGEARIVALAAFLADVTVAGATTPFLFDDPVSSLDIEFEERVVARLFELAKTRQVLVFTHRLSLLALLQQAAEASAEAAKITEGVQPVQLRRVRLERMGSRIGLATELSEKELPVHDAAKQIAEKRLAVAEAHFQEGRIAEYDQTMKAICSDLRIVTERAVEEVLMNKVVTRFRRSVTTMNRLTHLAKINSDDCAFLDDMMTRLSVWEHSQSEEAPATLPDIAVVRKDAQSLHKWVLDFKKRQVPEAQRSA
jgi:energy-coupling factor transporter ATP-binding protein EcfA2